MGDRPLRYHEGGRLPLRRSGSVDDLIERWVAHRDRFAAALGDLDEAQWSSPTRCDDWDVRDVVLHLVTVDQFWAFTLRSAQRGTATQMLLGFDPSSSPDALIDPMRDQPAAAVLEQLVTGVDALRSVVDDLADDDWHRTAESPLGQVAAHLALAHGFWDSWLHERDVLVPLGLAVEPDPADALLAADYSLLAAGVEGGIVDDPEAVAAGPTAPLDAVLVLGDVPDAALRLRVGTYDEGVAVDAVDAAAARAAGAPVVSAVALVEGFTGRAPLDDLGELPDDLRDHLERARQVL